jgi:hypothetical protein
MGGVSTVVLGLVSAEHPGTQALSLVQEAVLGAEEPGLGAVTQVFQVVIIVGLYEALEGPRAPV